MGRTMIRLAIALATVTAVTPVLPLTAPNAAAAERAPAAPAACQLRVIKNIKAGIDAQANAVNINPGSGEIYVAGQSGVEAINGQTYQLTRNITTGRNPEGIAVNPGTGTVYVASVGGTVSVINGSTNKVTATIHLGSAPLAVDVDQSNGRIYVIGAEGDIWIIKSSTNQVVGTIHLGDLVDDAALDPVTGLLYVTNDAYPGDPGTIFVVSVRTRQVVDRIYPGGDSHPDLLAVNPQTNTIYVTDAPTSGAGAVLVIKGSTNKITSRLTPVSGLIAVNPVADVFYVDSSDAGGTVVTALDGHDNEVLSTLQVSEPFFNSDAINPATGNLYLTVRTGRLVVLAGCQ
jgi:YVTN family beta-propeller protein